MSRTRVLGKTFFAQPTLTVAQELLGKYLVRKIGERTLAAMITEVEVYDGFHDKASHASRGLTPRTEVMFGPPGCWYVYFTYGMHWMLNIVTGKKGYPAAVLIRSVIVDADPRGLVCRPTRIINGPARVTKFFKIDKRFNGKSASRASRLWVKDMGVRIRKSQITKGKRIGVEYAGPVWAKKKWNLKMKNGGS